MFRKELTREQKIFRKITRTNCYIIATDLIEWNMVINYLQDNGFKFTEDEKNRKDLMGEIRIGIGICSGWGAYRNCYSYICKRYPNAEYITIKEVLGATNYLVQRKLCF